jgi:hypothetical protein
MTSGTVSFSATTPDIINAVCDFVAIFVFGSDPHMLRFLFRCAPDLDAKASNVSVAITLSQQTHVQRDTQVRHAQGEIRSMGSNRHHIPHGEWKSVVVTGDDEYALPVIRKVDEFSEDSKSQQGPHAV